MNGIVIKAISSFYYVDVNDEVFECKAKGLFKHKNTSICVGDEVEISVIDYDNKKGNIVKILPRINYLKRPVISNVTQAMIVFSVTSPDLNLSLLDRFLIIAQRENLETVIVLNKIDLDDNYIINKVRDYYKNTDYKIFAISAKGNVNIEELKSLLKNNKTIIAGPSGVGKSTLINKLIGTKQKTSDVSEKIGRGRHTTRYVEFIKIDKNSYLADSPGFSSIDLNEIDKEDLKNEFYEFHEYDIDCKFGSNCVHINEPDCLVKKAVKEGNISEDRYLSYVQLYNEIKNFNGRK